MGLLKSCTDRRMTFCSTIFRLLIFLLLRGIILQLLGVILCDGGFHQLRDEKKALRTKNFEY